VELLGEGAVLVGVHRDAPLVRRGGVDRGGGDRDGGGRLVALLGVLLPALHRPGTAGAVALGGGGGRSGRDGGARGGHHGTRVAPLPGRPLVALGRLLAGDGIAPAGPLRLVDL